MPDQSFSDALEENVQVLADMAAGGDDLSKARRVDFSHVFNDRDQAEAFERWAIDQGYASEMEVASDGSYDVTVNCTMVPESEAVTRCEQILAKAAEDLGGEADGWGCFAVPKLHS